MIWESLRGERQRNRTYNCSTRVKRGSTPPLVASPHRLLQKPPKPRDSDFKTSTHPPHFLFPFQFYVASLFIIIFYSSLNCLLHSCVLFCHYSGHKLLDFGFSTCLQGEDAECDKVHAHPGIRTTIKFKK